MINRGFAYRVPTFFLVVTLIVASSGCFAPPPLSTSTQLPTSITPVLEHSVTLTALPTRRPTATFAPSRTPHPLQTDLPTIGPGDGNFIVNSLNSKCRLSCWGNIIPGKTSQYAAKRFLSPLGEWNDDNPSLTIQYDNSSASIDFTFANGLVDSIQFYPPITNPYKINHLFTEYGVPEDIQLEVIPLTAELTTWFNLVLLYPRQGFFAVFSANGTPVNSIIHICPRNVSPDLYLFQSDTYSLDQMMEILSVVRPHIEFQPLNTLTDTDVNQFHEVFRNQSTTCVATKVRFQLP